MAIGFGDRAGGELKILGAVGGLRAQPQHRPAQPDTGEDADPGEDAAFEQLVSPFDQCGFVQDGNRNDRTDDILAPGGDRGALDRNPLGQQLSRSSRQLSSSRCASPAPSAERITPTAAAAAATEAGVPAVLN